MIILSPWLISLSGYKVSLHSKGSKIQFPFLSHPFTSLSPSLPLSIPPSLPLSFSMEKNNNKKTQQSDFFKTFEHFF